MATGCDLLLEGRTPVRVRDQTAPPCPAALWRMQLRRVGELRGAQAPRARGADALLEAGALVLGPSIRDHQSPSPGSTGQPRRQESRPRHVAPPRTHLGMGPSRQQGHGTRTVACRLGVPGGDRGDRARAGPAAWSTGASESPMPGPRGPRQPGQLRRSERARPWAIAGPRWPSLRRRLRRERSHHRPACARGTAVCVTVTRRRPSLQHPWRCETSRA
jgi:hypothetical protein